MKRILSLTIAVIIVVLAGCSSDGKKGAVLSEKDNSRNSLKQESPAEDFVYEINDEGVTISGYQGVDDKVIIPDIIEGNPIVRIRDNAFSGMELKRVSIPSGIEYIDRFAFQGCSYLEEVEFRGESKVRIGQHAFANCPKLRELRLPASAYFSSKEERIWLEEYKIWYTYFSETKIALPFDEDDTTIMVVKCGSEVHKTLQADVDVQDKYRVE